MAIKLTVMSAGQGSCALTGKNECDGLTVAFENEAPCFVSWKAFRQLLAFKTAQTGKPNGQPQASPPAPVARPS